MWHMIAILTKLHRAMTPKFELGQDFLRRTYPKFHHPVFTHSEVIFWQTHKQTNKSTHTHKQTDPSENNNVLRNATALHNYINFTCNHSLRTGHRCMSVLMTVYKCHTLYTTEQCILQTIFTAYDSRNIISSDLHCELKKTPECLLSHLPQNQVDSDKIWYTLSWRNLRYSNLNVFPLTWIMVGTLPCKT